MIVSWEGGVSFTAVSSAIAAGISDIPDGKIYYSDALALRETIEVPAAQPDQPREVA